MNKKFSTLLASVLLTSAFTVSAGNVNYTDLKSGRNVALNASSVAVAIDAETGALKGAGSDATTLATNVTGTTAESIKSEMDALNAVLWRAEVIENKTTTGIVKTYRFSNKKTGEYLAFNLKTNGETNVATKMNQAGNKVWAVNTNKVLYAYVPNAEEGKDSTYYLNSNYALCAVQGDPSGIPDPTSGALALTLENIDAAKITLSAPIYNYIMGMQGNDGKLHFNGDKKDVSTGESNVLTDNKFVAYPLAGNDFALAVKDKETAINKNPYLLMADTTFYSSADGGKYNKLTVADTLALTKTQVDAWKAGTNGLSSYAPTHSVSNYPRAIEAASFEGLYFVANDSIALAVKGLPDRGLKNAITDEKSILGSSAAGSEINSVSALPGATVAGASEVGEIKALVSAVNVWTGKAQVASPEEANGFAFSFKKAKFTVADGPTVNMAEAGNAADSKVEGKIGVWEKANAWVNNADNSASQDLKDYVAAAGNLKRLKGDASAKIFWAKGYPYLKGTENAAKVALTELSTTRVLTVAKQTANNETDADLATAGFTAPLIQPFATTGGDAVITTGSKLYTLQVKNTEADVTLRATAQNDKYLVSYDENNYAVSETADAENVYAQWAFVEGLTGTYQVINRGSKYVLYTGPVSKVKDASGKVVADTYVLGADTLKLAGVTITTNIYEEKDGKFDYSGYFYAGPTKDKSYTFSIAPVAAIMNDLGAQFNKDSVMVLGKAEDAPVWYFQEAGGETYGLEIDGLTQLKYMTYKIFTKNANGDSLYVYATGKNNYAVTNKGYESAKFALREINKGQYLFVNGDKKMTINPTPAQPVLEVTAITSAMRDDYFVIASASSNDYRTLTAEDGVNGNVKIFMNNEPYRYLYENTANIVANNGNKIAKDSLNFLGIYNAAASSKNAAIYVDTAYVNRKGVTMPQYMFALGVEAHEATPAAPCTESGVHVDKDGKPTTADKCVHATPAKKAYKTGRYLVSVADSASTAKHPAKYDGAFRLAFVEAIHVEGSDSLIIVNSKYTNNTNAIESGKATTYASKDTLKFENDKPNVATFALLIKDQADKSFYLETANKTYVRILNGVPVLTDNIENAAIFNIEATTEEATANEAIEAAGVQVIGGKGAVTVQGAAGKVITVANVLGQTIANQVAASDNVTIAAPAGVVVVAVEGEATKVVVK